MGIPASPFSDGSYSIDSRVNQDFIETDWHVHVPVHRLDDRLAPHFLDLGPVHDHDIAIVAGGTEMEKEGGATGRVQEIDLVDPAEKVEAGHDPNNPPLLLYQNYHVFSRRKLQSS